MIELLEDEQRQSLFFDTYAFLEILRGSEHYKKYASFNINTTKLNIFELYLRILRDVSSEEAEKVLKKYYPFVVDFNEEVIKQAAQLKILLNKRDLSMADCIGYCLAKQLGIKFLTGDKQFGEMDNVEYVK